MVYDKGGEQFQRGGRAEKSKMCEVSDYTCLFKFKFRRTYYWNIFPGVGEVSYTKAFECLLRNL